MGRGKNICVPLSIPPQYACVVPDHLFHEIATSESCDPVERIQRFGAWAAKNHTRLWLGRTQEDIFSLQLKNGGHRLWMQDIVHIPRTQQLRRLAAQPSYDWRDFLESVRGGGSINRRENDIRQHVVLCKEINMRWHNAYPRRPLWKPEDRANWIRQPDLINALLKAYAPWRQEWTSTIANDPNRFALVRWIQFVLWYCMKRIDGQTKKFENNFDDAIYGLLASYTDHLCTNDGGLQRAVKAIFPHIRVLDKEFLT